VLDAPLYPDRFASAGITIVLPTPDEREYIHEIYLGELVPGVVRDETREHLAAIIATMRDRDGIDGLVLGGTELPLILPQPAYGGVPMLNTTRIHVDAAIDWLLDVRGPGTDES
jgi:aspartate racemase